MTVHQHIPFDKLYGDGQKTGPLMPWNIGGPQPAVRALCDEGGFSGHVLDIGCGLGDNALYLASTGLQVTGVDISEIAVESARQKAKQVGLDVEFLAADAFSLAEAGTRYDTVLDSAFFHTLPRTEIASYLALLDAITTEDATLHLFTFATELTPDFPGPRRSSAAELRADFGTAWTIHTISSARYSSSLPAEAVEQMVDPHTFELNAPTENLAAVSVDETGCVVSSIWHMHAQRAASAGAATHSVPEDRGDPR
ncbi:class I SAM-dependent methyltransferase [Dermacoccus abyssi]